MKRLLDAIDGLTLRINPLSLLLDRIVEKLVPHMTAAACSGYFCYSNCVRIGGNQRIVDYYSFTLGCPEIDCTFVTSTDC